jgi:hypothetical protein
MRIRVVLLFLVLFTLCSSIKAQTSDEKKIAITGNDSVSIEYQNLYINARENIAGINGAAINNRNGKIITVGTEISGSFFYREYPWMESYGVSLALYPGRSNAFEKSSQVFRGQSSLYHNYSDKPSDYSNNDSFISFTPGISLYSKNRKISVDLYHMLSTQPFLNGKQQLVPYKVNFHF